VRAGIWAACWMLVQVQTNSLNMTSDLLQKSRKMKQPVHKRAGFLSPSKIPSANFEIEREARGRANI
jgi:hypothetical protein